MPSSSRENAPGDAIRIYMITWVDGLPPSFIINHPHDMLLAHAGDINDRRTAIKD